MEMNRKWRLAVPMAAALLVAACTAEGPTGTGSVPTVANFALDVPGNGFGQCLLAETQAAGFLNNVTSLNCTSNDVEDASITISEFKVGDGNWTKLSDAPGGKIECTPGQKILTKSAATIQNNAQERYDFGFWYNPTHGGSALTGAGNSCLHYNLIPGKNGALDLDGATKGATADACGDVASKAPIHIDLGEIEFTCPGGGATTITTEACSAWANGNTGSNDRICPVGHASGVGASRADWGQGTTPGTTAKCHCNQVSLPILVKAGLTVRKVWVGSAPPQPLTGSTSIRIGSSIGGTDVGSGTSNAPTTTVVGPFMVNPGDYYFSENPNPPTGYTSALTCTRNGNSITPGANGLVTVVGGDNVVCTFTNTRQTGTIQLRKVWGGNQFAATSLRIGTDAGGSQIASQAGGANLTTFSTSVVTVNTGTYHLSEDLTNLAGYTITIACTRNGNAATVTTVNSALQRYSIAVNANDAVVCTFTNTLNIFQQWCSPGYWRNAKWDFWTFLGISSGKLYSTVPNVNNTKPALKNGISDATLLQILNAPQTYGGPAYNYVASYLSGLHPGINYSLGTPVQEDHECPINAFGQASGS